MHEIGYLLLFLGVQITFTLSTVALLQLRCWVVFFCFFFKVVCVRREREAFIVVPLPCVRVQPRKIAF